MVMATMIWTISYHDKGMLSHSLCQLSIHYGLLEVSVMLELLLTALDDHWRHLVGPY